MNVLALLLGGGAITAGVGYAAVKGRLTPPTDPICAYPGDLYVLTFAASRELASTDVGALQWSFQQNFPGIIEGIAALDATTVAMNVQITTQTLFQLGSAGVFADIVLQLVSIEKVGEAPPPPSMPGGPTVYA